jgi:hypothetical protein
MGLILAHRGHVRRLADIPDALGRAAAAEQQEHGEEGNERTRGTQL